MSELETLHEEIESLKKELARAEGTKDHLLQQLKDNHQVQTVEEAKKLQVAKKQECEQLKVRYDELMKEYRSDRQKRLEATEE